MWITPRTPSESLEILDTLSELTLSNFFVEHGTECTDYREIAEAVRVKDYLKLVNYELDYERLNREFVDQDGVYLLRQVLAFYAKLDFLDLGYNRKVVAAQKFIEAEQQCLNTNNKLAFHARRPNNIPSSVHSIHFAAIGKIASILGVVPEIDDLKCVFGPGANTSVKGAVACPRAKLSAPLACSNELAESGYLSEVLNSVPHWTELHYDTCDSDLQCDVDSLQSSAAAKVSVEVHPGKVVFVPKSAKTDRTICVEPLLNSFLQKGIGTYMRERLARHGIDLSNQTNNQHLAMVGSATGGYATIDLSSASDCVSRELVWSLLPYSWGELLDSARTGDVHLPKEFGEFASRDVHLQKFSSMGNAYTFELETLIFYALASSVYEQIHKRPCKGSGEVFVYGDDIVVPTDCYELTQEVLEYYGFTLNKGKSFCSGPFRESCGADFYFGSQIRPFYQKTLVSDRTLYTMHNFFIRNGEKRLADCVKSYCKSPKLYGPDGYGDGHLIGDHSLRLSRSDRRKGWCGGYFDTYTLKPRFYKKLLVGDAVLPVYSIYVRSGEMGPTDPNRVRGTQGYTKIAIYTLGQTIFKRLSNDTTVAPTCRP